MREMVQYLQEAAAQECQMYSQTTLLSMLNQKVKKLGVSQHYVQPKKRTWKFELIGDGTFVRCLLLGTVFFFYNFVRVCMAAKGGKEWLSVFTTPIKFICVIFIIDLVVRNIYNYFAGKNAYVRQVHKYNAAVETDHLRVQKELQYKEVLIQQITLVNQEKEKTQAALKKLYSLNIIHPKYRNLVAICSFYDYFDTGRCVSLTGPGGAYATFEDDLRFKRIETRLDVIISKLDEIIDNQQYIGNLMREANVTLSRIDQRNNQIANSINCVAKNTELIAYNTRCAAQSASVIEHISMYYALKNF